MKYIRKRLVSVLVIIAILLSLTGIGVANATIYETVTMETITSGVNLQKMVKFTNDGWLRINVLRVDLDNPNVEVDTISNKDSITKLSNVKTLAESNGAIAAVNAGFFNWMKESGRGYPDGPIIESSEIVSASTEFNRYQNSMATFSIDNLNNLLYEYWKTNMEIIAPNASPATVTQYNKPSTQNYNDITIFSRKWGEKSLGVSPEYPDILEMVVDDGRVKEIRKDLPAVNIPENGYVIITRGSNAQFIEQNYKVGDRVGFSIYTAPDWQKLKMAVSGSAVLVQDGKIPPKFSYDIGGRHPRTAVGSTSNGKVLLLVTVDGRQEGSIGMTQMEFAKLLLSLGAYNAINLDGGGSTTMVTRETGTTNVKIVNNPSDSLPRAVTNAIGVFAIMPPSELEGIVIETTDENVFANSSIDFTVKGYDTYFNPVELDKEKIEWSVSGIEGTFNDNVLFVKSKGTGKITAKIGDISASIQIKSLDSPGRLILNRDSLKIPTTKSHTFTVKGVDKNGVTANINPIDLKWNVVGDIGKFDKNVFTATRNGTGYISASLGDTHAYCAVSVAVERLEVKDTFDTLNGTFLSAPSGTPGSYELSDERKMTGNYSGKLTYDFSSNLESTRAAYLVFSNDGIPIEKDTTKIGLWVYNTHENTNWVRAEVLDESGKKYLLDFINGMNWTGWKYLECDLGSVKSPSKLTRVYIAQINPVPDSGYLYFEQLSFKKSTFPEFELDKIPQNTVPVDKANMRTDFTRDTNSFRFSVFAGKGSPDNLLEKLLLTKLSEKINDDVETCALIGSGKIDTSLYAPRMISVDKSFSSVDIDNSRLIVMDTSNKGIRSSAFGQWQWFLNELKSTSTQNVFILMKEPLSSFTDKEEAALFKNIITEYRESSGKNIWVLYKGSSDESYLENGIKYFSIKGLDSESLNPDKAEEVKYLEVTVKDDNITYQFIPLID